MVQWYTCEWTWLSKHEPKREKTWAQVVNGTGPKKFAKFAFDLSKPTWEIYFERNRRKYAESISERFYYAICPQIIGASCGEETIFVKIRWLHDNTIHAFPISYAELISELREHCQDEYERLLDELRILDPRLRTWR